MGKISKTILIILGMGVVTYLPRMGPLVLLANRTIPEGLIRWLRFVPAAVLAALLAPELLLREGGPGLSLSNHYLLAALPCFAVAVRTKNLFLTVFIGIGAVMLLQYLL